MLISHHPTLRESLQPGKHRPIYLWAGQGTVRMNRLKFMEARVDESVHLQAHTLDGARRAIGETGCRWAYLMYNWGFPPEVERADWESFEAAARAYHQAGGLVFAYIQSSNCVYDGSFREKDWYAQDWHGRKIFYYTGRYMTCWEHPDWLAYLKERVSDALRRGADGIFFDNPWHAGQPMHFGGAWLGGAGCYCERCRAAYRLAVGQEIPRVIRPGRMETDVYLRWRQERVTHRLRDLAEYTRSLKHDVPVSVNDFDAVMRASSVTAGIELRQLAQVQDVIMIEDYGLPSWNADTGELVNNAVTLRTAHALCGDTPLSVDPYDKGIGFDRVFPARRSLQAIAEASACRASCVVKGTEFVDEDGNFTLLTDERYTDVRLDIGKFNQWLDERSGMLNGGRNLAQIGLLYPQERLWHKGGELARIYFACAQALLSAGLPWRAVLPGDDLLYLKTLLVFDLRDLRGMKLPGQVGVLEVPRLDGWQIKDGESWLDRSPLLRRLSTRVISETVRGYFASRMVRRFLDGAGAMRLFTGSPFFRLPDPTARKALLEALPQDLRVKVNSAAPVLVEVWEHDGTLQVHLVNYASQAQAVTVRFDRPVRAEVWSHDRLLPATIEGQELRLEVDVYSIMVVV